MSRKKRNMHWLYYFLIGIFTITALGLIGDGEIGAAIIPIAIAYALYKYKIKKQPASEINIQRSEPVGNNSHANNEKQQTYRKKRAFVDDYTVIDFETTGFSPYQDEIIEIGAVKFSKGKPGEQFNTFIKPYNPISSHITAINGIDNSMVKDSPRIHEVLPEFLNFIGNDVIVAHNASFDMKFLLASIEKSNIDYEVNNMVSDTLSLSRKHFPMLKNHKLETLKKHFKLEKYKSHRAADDCIVTGKVYWECNKNSN